MALAIKAQSHGRLLIMFSSDGLWAACRFGLFAKRDLGQPQRDLPCFCLSCKKINAAVLITSIKFDRGELKISHHPDELSQPLQGKQAIMFAGKYLLRYMININNDRFPFFKHCC